MLDHSGLRKMRIELMLSSAAFSGLMLVSQVANAQSLPQTPNVVQGTATVSPAGPNRLDIAVGAGGNIINWDSFNIASGRRVDFSSTGSASVLNRVIGSTGSSIDGSLTSGANVDVWLINTNGIVFGGGAVVNTGGFVASTLDIDDADFLDGRANDRFFSSTATSGSISSVGGQFAPATIRTKGGHLALIAPVINVQANFSAGSGDAAFVIANDVSMAAAPGSPLAFTINEGTPVDGNGVINGAVNGRNVFYVMATQQGVTNALLNVGATTRATTAALTDRGIVLFADGVSNAGDPNVILGGALFGTAGANVTGEQTILGSGGGFTALVQGNLGITQRILADNTDGFINILADRSVNSSSLLQAKNNINVSSDSIDLVTANAGGILSLTASVGDLKLAVGRAGTDAILESQDNLTAGSVTSVLGEISLTALNSINAGNLDANTSLYTASSLGSIKIDNAASKTSMNLSAAFGDITIAGLANSVNGPLRAFGQNVLIGNANAGGALDVQASNNITLGNGTSDANISLLGGSAGTININGTLSGKGDIIATGANIFANNIFSSMGTVQLTSGVINVGNIRAKTDINAMASDLTLPTNAITIGSALAEGNIDLGAGLGSVQVTGQLNSSGGNISVMAKTVNVASLTTGMPAVGSPTGEISIGGEMITVGNAVSGSSINMVSTGTVLAGNIIAAGPVTITAPNSVTVNGALSSNNSTVNVSGGSVYAGRANAQDLLSLTSTSGSLFLGTGAAGSVSLTSAADLSINGTLDGDNGLTLLAENGAINAGNLSSQSGAVSVTGKSVVANTVSSDPFSNNTIPLTTPAIQITSSAGPLIIANAFADGNIALDSAAGLTVAGQVRSEGGNATVKGTNVSIGSISALSPAGIIDVTGSSVSINNALSGGNATIKSTGDLTVSGQVNSANGQIDVSGKNVSLAAVTAGMGNVTVLGETVNIGNAKSGQALDITATAGNLSYDNTVAGTTIKLMASGAISSLGTATSGGDANITGGSLDLRAANSGGVLNLTSTNGNLTLGSGSANGDIKLASFDALKVAGTIVSTNGSINGTGNSIDIGNAVAKTTLDLKAATGALTIGIAQADNNVMLMSETGLDVTGVVKSVNGAVTATGGTVNIKQAVAKTDFSAEAKIGNLTLGASATDGLTTLKSAGDLFVTAPEISASALVLDARGAVVTNDLFSGAGNVSVTGASLSLKNINAADDLLLTSTTGGINVVNARAGGAATLTSAGAMSANSIRSSDAAILTAVNNITANSVISANSLVDIKGQSVTLGNAEAASNASITATTGPITVNNVIAGANILLTTPGNLNVSSQLNSTNGAITANGGAVAITAANAASPLGTIDINGTSVAMGNAISGAALSVKATGGPLTIDNAVAGGTATLNSASALKVNGVVKSASDFVSVTGRSVDIAVAEAGTTLNIQSTNGIINLGRGVAAGNVDIVSADALDITEAILSSGGWIKAFGTKVSIGNAFAKDVLEVTATQGALKLASGNAAAITLKSVSALDVSGALKSTSGIIMATGGAVNIAQANAATNLTVESKIGDLAIGNSTAGGATTLTAAGAITAIDVSSVDAAVLTAANNITANSVKSTNSLIDIKGQSVTLGNAEAASNATITATTGPVTANNVIAGANILLTTPGNLSVSGQLNSTNGAITANGGAVEITAANAKSPLGTIDINGSSVIMGNAMSGSALSVKALGGALTIDNATAGTSATLSATGALKVNGQVEGTASSVSILGGSVDVVSAKAGSTLSVESGAGGIKLGSGTAAGDSTLNSAGDLNVAGTIRVSAGSLAATGANNVDIGNAIADKSLNIKATAGALNVGIAQGGTDVTLTAGTGLNVDGLVKSNTGNVTAVGGTVNIRQANAEKDLIVTSKSGAINLVLASANGDTVIDSATSLNVTNAIEGKNVKLTAVGAVETASINATQGSVRVTGSSILATDVSAVTTLNVESSASGISLDSAMAGGNLSLVSKGSLTVRNQVRSSGSVTASGTVVDIGTAASGGPLDIQSQSGNLTLNAASSNSTLVLKSAANLEVVDTLTATGQVNLTAAGALKTGSLASGASNISVIGQSVDVASAAAAGNINFSAANCATLGALTAGANSTVGISSGQIALKGEINAGTVYLAKAEGSAGIALIGDFTASTGDGYALSNTELDLIKSNDLTIDSSRSDLDVGNLTFKDASGKNNVSLFTFGQLFVRGTVKGSGLGRTFIIGGSVEGGFAESILLNATPITTTDPSGGGRLLLGNSNVEIQGARIVAGLTSFINAVGFENGGTGFSTAVVERSFIHNEASQLYSASNGSSEGYLNDTTPLLSANNLTLRYTDYALFQNTGGEGVRSGINLDGPLQPNRNLLTLDASQSNGQNAFAFFGTLGGVANELAALQGPPIIVLNGVNPSNSRINGCLIGSTAGCLTATVVQILTGIIKNTELNVVKIETNENVLFNPIVGTNNESLFSAELSSPADPAAETVCANGNTNCNIERRDNR